MRRLQVIRPMFEIDVMDNRQGRRLDIKRSISIGGKEKVNLIPFQRIGYAALEEKIPQYGMPRLWA